MNFKNKKILKFLYVLIISFILINTFAIFPIFAASGNIVVKTKVGATILKLLITVAQVTVSGYFVIRMTIFGIQYFTAVAASDKANLKNKLYWNLIYAVGAFLAMYLISYVAGL